MATFLTTLGTSSRIEEIITEAKREIYLVSPFLQFSKNFHERLLTASNHNVVVRIIYGKSELNEKERGLLAEIDGLELYFLENLHAKCYFNENKMVISSMNMYEYSQTNNREMGVFIEYGKDKELFENARREALAFLECADRDKLYKSNSFYHENRSHGKSQWHRYCIRCGRNIPFNPEKPYCNHCFSTWSQFENVHYEESNCHGCGNSENATLVKPLCYRCYKAYNK